MIRVPMDFHSIAGGIMRVAMIASSSSRDLQSISGISFPHGMMVLQDTILESRIQIIHILLVLSILAISIPIENSISQVKKFIFMGYSEKTQRIFLYQQSNLSISYSPIRSDANYRDPHLNPMNLVPSGLILTSRKMQDLVRIR